MIPELFIEDWRENVRWSSLSMIEQDLIISRALVCLYNNSHIKESLLFRGGTALNKLFLNPPARYSEDLDFVQSREEPIVKTIDEIRASLFEWLGEPKRKITNRGAKLYYRFQSVGGFTAHLKIEINTTEHFQVLPARYMEHSVKSLWFEGKCEIGTYFL